MFQEVPAMVTRRKFLAGTTSVGLLPFLLRQCERAIEPRTHAQPRAHAVPRRTAETRGALFARADLVAGSQMFFSSPVLPGEPGFSAAQAAQLRSVRWQSAQIPATLGGQTSPDVFTGGIKAIQSMGSVPLIGVPPIGMHNTLGGSDPWSYPWQQWVVKTATGLGCTLFEMGNEPMNYMGWSAQQYFSNVWVNVPKLKALARSLGHQVFFGGPASTAFCSASGRLSSWIEPWLSMCQQRFTATGNHDWIPDYVTVHCYGGAPATGPGSISQAMTFLAANFDRLRAVLNKMAGPSPGTTGSAIKMINSEYDAGINANIGNSWQSQPFMDEYFTAIFKMARAPTVDGSQRVWMMNQFCIIDGGGPVDLLNPDGSPRPAYHALSAQTTAL
jgi:hypothetical protein